MKEKKTYTSAKAFRTALEERLNSIAKRDNTDIQRLRIQVSFDRLLARLFAKQPTPWLLKGGYAMQLRIKNARATKDVDLAMKEARFLKGTREEKDLALLELLQERASEDLGDYFVFRIGLPTMDLDAAPYGGSRFPVEAFMDGRSYVKFQIDIGIGDIWIEPIEMLSSTDLLDFAGIESNRYPAISKEQQFAEKIHAYTLPRNKPNSRVKDLVDMFLLISSEVLNSELLRTAVDKTFKRRDTHDLELPLNPPPENWSRPFEALAKDCGLEPNMETAFRAVQDYLAKIQ